MEGLKGAPLRIFVIAKEPWLLGPSKFLIFPKPIWANAVIFLFLLNFYFPPPFGPPKEVYQEYFFFEYPISVK